MKLNTIEEVLEDLRLGRMVIIMDDEDRENEGDLVMAADRVTPDAINFMARFGRGLICLTLTRDRCRQLRLPLMVSDTDDQHSTNFTLSIEAAEGITTGISAHGSAPARGVNAVYKMADIIQDVARLNQKLVPHEPLGKGSVALSQIRSKSPSLCAVADNDDSTPPAESSSSRVMTAICCSSAPVKKGVG